MKKYINLFNQFSRLEKVDMMSKLLGESTLKTVLKHYPNPESLISFNEKKYRQLYKEWGNLGIFEQNISPINYGMINYNIEKVDSGLRSGFSVQSSLVINPIEKFGSEKLKNNVLDKLYSGEYIGCFGLTEPNSGSDPSGIKSRAVSKDDYYIVNGSKIWITNSPVADVFVIWCKDETNNIIGLVSERNDSIQTPFINDKISLLSSPTGYIHLNDLKIPKTNKLNINGLSGPFSCLNKARYGISWGVVGSMEAMINIAIDYTEERKQFNKTLNSFQIVQNDLIKCVENYNNSLNNSFASLNCIETLDDLRKNVALISYLKRVNCENALNTSRICRDLLGGNGITNSYNIMRHLVNLEAVNTYEGTKNIHNLILAREILGKNTFN